MLIIQFIADGESFSESLDEISVNNTNAADTVDVQIDVCDVESFYKEKSSLEGYLKDCNGTPISNKQVNVVLNGQSYNKTTDGLGKFSLALNLKPDTYKVNLKFIGDENYTSHAAGFVFQSKSL